MIPPNQKQHHLVTLWGFGVFHKFHYDFWNSKTRDLVHWYIIQDGNGRCHSRGLFSPKCRVVVGFSSVVTLSWNFSFFFLSLDIFLASSGFPPLSSIALVTTSFASFLWSPRLVFFWTNLISFIFITCPNHINCTCCIFPSTASTLSSL